MDVSRCAERSVHSRIYYHFADLVYPVTFLVFGGFASPTGANDQPHHTPTLPSPSQISNTNVAEFSVCTILGDRSRAKLPSVVLRNLPATATITMESIDRALGSVVDKLHDGNYSESFAFYRFWFDIAQNHHQVPSDQIFDAIWKNRGTSSMDPGSCKVILSTAHLVLRFARDAELDDILAPYSSGLQSRLSASSLRDFFSNNVAAVWYKETGAYSGGAQAEFSTDTNLIAHWTNLGYVEEAVIRNQILQSLISHPKLWDHQVDALITLFKVAGATFERYADPSVVDRCFELLKGHDYCAPYPTYDSRYHEYPRIRKELVQVSAPRVVECGHQT